MESGCDEVLKLICKGTTRAEQIEGGRRARQAGFELSEYIMPGLGGRALTDAHADDSASALVEIQPDFVRLRTTAVIPGTPLFEMQEKGEFEPLTEVELVREIRRFLAGLKGLTTRLESDHILNLLMELRGDLPADLDELISVCDQFLDLDDQLKLKFILARRMGWMGTLKHLDTPALDKEVDRIVKELKAKGVDPEEVFRELRTRMV
jgi:hypothetical protein